MHLNVLVEAPRKSTGWYNGMLISAVINNCLPDPMVNRRMPQYKKHKTWDGDAVLVLNGAKGTMYDLEGKLYAPSFYRYSTRLNVNFVAALAPAL